MKKVYWIDPDRRIVEWYFVVKSGNRTIIQNGDQVMSLPTSQVFSEKKAALLEAVARTATIICNATDRMKRLMADLNAEQTAEPDRPRTDITV